MLSQSEVIVDDKYTQQVLTTDQDFDFKAGTATVRSFGNFSSTGAILTAIIDPQLALLLQLLRYLFRRS